MDTYGGADILVNNAGIQYIAPVQDFPPEKWQEIIAVNLSAAFMMTHYLLPAMQAKQWGRVVNIASVHGLVASVNKSAYVSAKHGLIGFTKAAALENAASGITVNAVCPGWVETELIKHQYKTLAEKRGISVEDGKQELIREKQPNLRFISPDQLADIVLFMCSDSAAGITGSSYTVDGGWTAHLIYYFNTGMKVTLVGGGIIGLCTAYYLKEAGYDVSLYDDTVIEKGTSHGNMGYISPSHVEPLANPYKLAQGLKWMFNSSSPFYIRPSIYSQLGHWLLRFLASCRPDTLRIRAKALGMLNDLSLAEYKILEKKLGSFTIQKKGLFMLTCLEKEMEKLEKEQQFAAEFGQLSSLISARDIARLDPNLKSRAVGGLYFAEDCHIDPSEFMSAMKSHLLNNGVEIHENSPVRRIETAQESVSALYTDSETIKSDVCIITAGVVVCRLEKRLCLLPAKGYSVTLPAPADNFTVPYIITEKSVAATPLGTQVRFGSTLELGKHDNRIMAKRVNAITQAVRDFMPEYSLPDIQPADYWYGYRPCSFDGLPFIGKIAGLNNLYIAAGHGMLGVTQATGTGKLLTEIIAGHSNYENIKPFDPQR
ncbi:hypothetical protein CHS0354_006830 [Potamilus streckersoni]|uniref:3-oxoacyl-[acyl-carrier-protein] reductase n=1 Tax=Potamilus streckersoni TaxID=2493646 RepID=A0AAE0WC48_9BIVA|nr:hypothetical protein CHS0354_006830 [Potamilus streckersoni]